MEILPLLLSFSNLSFPSIPSTISDFDTQLLNKKAHRLTMPDAFFQKKRKRTPSSSASASGSRAGPSRSKPSSSSSSSARPRKGSKHADSGSDDDDDVPGGGIDDMDLLHRYDHDANSDDEAEAAETPAEARVRLAKMYLQGLSSSNTAATSGGEGDDFFESADTPAFGLADAAQADRDNIAARLQKDVAEQSGKIHLFLSHRLVAPSTAAASSEDGATYDYSNSMLAVRGHRLSVTSAVASSDAKWLFTASKDGNIIRWRLRDGQMMRILPRRSRHLDSNGEALPPTSNGKSKSSGAARRRARHTSATTYLPIGEDQGHTDEILSLSLSSDGQYLASGGRDKRVCIWRIPPSSETFLKTLSGHKDAITAVSFRDTSHELYTASLDRTLKLYDVSQLSYIETLFGHQESVLSLSCLSSETAVSAGGRDRTCRYWKIRDESQLVFRAGTRSKLRTVLEGGDLASDLSSPGEAHEGSVEAVCMIDNHHFISGGDSGTISLWNLGRKKPVFSVPVAHGFDETHSETEGVIRTPRWITALGALAYGDVFVSGSWDGTVRVWGLTTAGPGQVKGFRELFKLDVKGVVNSLQVIQPPLNSVVVDPETKVMSSTAVRRGEWKRRSGLTEHITPNTEEEQERGERLTRIKTSKDNSPPIVIIGVGQEHKFGRWISDKSAKNGALVVPLPLSDAASTDGFKTNGDRFKLV